MRAFDVLGIGLALALISCLGWWLGRGAGRRDWRVSTMLLVMTLLTLTVQVGLLLLMAWLETQTPISAGRELSSLFGRRAVEALESPEFPAFLFIFGAFVSMLGWSSTPTQKKPELAG